MFSPKLFFFFISKRFCPPSTPSSEVELRNMRVATCQATCHPINNNQNIREWGPFIITHAPCLDISSQHTFWLSFTWSLQLLNAQIKLRSPTMVIIPHRTVQFYSPSQFRSSSSDPRIRSLRSAHLDDNFLARSLLNVIIDQTNSLCTAPDQQRHLKTPSLLVNIPFQNFKNFRISSKV